VGSIPTVSTSTDRRFSFHVGDWGVFLVVDPLSAVVRRGFDAAKAACLRRDAVSTPTVAQRLLPERPLCVS